MARLALSLQLTLRQHEFELLRSNYTGAVQIPIVQGSTQQLGVCLHGAQATVLRGRSALLPAKLFRGQLCTAATNSG